MAFPKFTWDKSKGGKKKDPINLVFTNTSLKNILVYLEEQGWYFTSNLRNLAFDQFTPDNPPRTLQNAQRIYGDLWLRHHIRIWNSDDQIIGAVHYEGIRLAFGHYVYSFEGAEDKIADEFKKSKHWNVEEDKHLLDNYIPDIYNDGYATEIHEI